MAVKDLNSKVDVSTYTSKVNELQNSINTKATKDVATTSANGLMSSADKTKLDGIATGANKYTHPTTAGNKHIPSGGASGQFLKWSADGTAVWANDNNTTYTAGTGLTLSGTTFSANIGTGSGQVAAGNHTHSYLPLSGGTMTGEIQMNDKAIKLTTTDNGYPRIGYASDSQDVYISNANNNWFRIKADKTISIAGKKVYTEIEKPTASDVGALPLAGGTLTGKLVAKNAGFTSDSVGNTIGEFSATSDHVFIANVTAKKYLQIYNDGTLRYSGLKIYHEGYHPLPHTIGAIATSGDNQKISGGLTVSGGTLTAEKNISTPSIYSEVSVMTADSGKVGTGLLEINGNGNNNQFWLAIDGYNNLAFQARHKGGWYSNPLLLNKDYVQVGVELRTNYDNSFNIGNSNSRWKAVYAANGTIQTSDMRMKSDIRDIDDEIFFNMIKNTGVHSYVLNYKDMPEGITQEEAPEEQVHVGIIAQEMDQYEGSRYILNVDENGQYSVNNYNLTSAVMAALKVEITKREELEDYVKSLEKRLELLENK